MTAELCDQAHPADTSTTRCGSTCRFAIARWLLISGAFAAVSGCVGAMAPGVKTSSSGKASKNIQTAASFTDDTAETPHINHQTKFSSREFGVQGSPRVSTVKRPRKGGGRYQIGKAYQIRGEWYRPRLDPDLKQVGFASWYGPNFHGRLTANGEIYDQYALTAAHPTMPLPSYARVTNLENGRKITVRVNDRGPFSRKRVIDLSARAARLLGYTKKGLAKVKVEYVGKARMDGLDEEKLMASYVGPRGVDPGIPGSNQSGSGTMLAMAGPKAPNGPVNAISNSFSTSNVALGSGGIGVPTARPISETDIFEGIPMAQSAGGEPATVVYRVKPLKTGPVPANRLSYLADNDPQGPHSEHAVDHRISKIRSFNVAYHGDHPDTLHTIDLGTLDPAAVEIVSTLTDDLTGRKIVTGGGLVTIVLREAFTNTALARLKNSGLSGAAIR